MESSEHKCKDNGWPISSRSFPKHKLNFHILASFVAQDPYFSDQCTGKQVEPFYVSPCKVKKSFYRLSFDDENELWRYDKGEQDQAETACVSFCRRSVDIHQREWILGPIESQNDTCDWAGLLAIKADNYQWISGR
ncbi:MAG: hypothetical protein AAF206_22280 [Bacteroidota bacterium]